jgi:hypothetical protein
VRGRVQSPAGFQLRIELREILPPIWRRFQVPGAVTLPGLHRVIREVIVQLRAVRPGKDQSWVAPIVPESPAGVDDRTALPTRPTCASKRAAKGYNLLRNRALQMHNCNIDGSGGGSLPATGVRSGVCFPAFQGREEPHFL